MTLLQLGSNVSSRDLFDDDGSLGSDREATGESCPISKYNENQKAIRMVCRRHESTQSRSDWLMKDFEESRNLRRHAVARFY